MLYWELFVFVFKLRYQFEKMFLKIFQLLLSDLRLRFDFHIENHLEIRTFHNMSIWQDWYRFQSYIFSDFSYNFTN